MNESPIDSVIKLIQISKKDMKTIGLTGGIGSGKSYISRIFQVMEIPIYNSDQNAKLLMTNSKELKNEIIALLGKKAYNDNGELNRDFIAKEIFHNNAKLAKMNLLVHPAVRNDFEKFILKHKKASYVINEAALFVENGTFNQFDYLISVVAPIELRIKRVMLRDSCSREEVLNRMKKQLSDEKKISVSDFIIYNDVTENLFSQISGIHRALAK